MDANELIRLIRDERDVLRGDLIWLSSDYRAERSLYETTGRGRARYEKCLTVPLDKLLNLQLTPTEEIALYSKIFNRPIRGILNVSTLEACAFSRAVNGALKIHSVNVVREAVKELARG